MSDLITVRTWSSGVGVGVGVGPGLPLAPPQEIEGRCADVRQFVDLGYCTPVGACIACVSLAIPAHLVASGIISATSNPLAQGGDQMESWHVRRGRLSTVAHARIRIPQSNYSMSIIWWLPVHSVLPSAFHPTVEGKSTGR